MSVQTIPSFSSSAPRAPSPAIVPPFFERSLGFWLLLLLPASAAFVYVLFLQVVDRDWMYLTTLSFSNDAHTAAMLAPRLASKAPMWHFGKIALWPIILLCVEILVVATLCMIVAQLSGVTTKLRHFFVAGLWSKATYLFIAFVMYARLLLNDSPVRILSKDLDMLSWNSILELQGDRPLQFLASNQGPIVLVSIAILALAYRRLTGRGWAMSMMFGVLPYGLWLASQYYLFVVVFK